MHWAYVWNDGLCIHGSSLLLRTPHQTASPTVLETLARLLQIPLLLGHDRHELCQNFSKRRRQGLFVKATLRYISGFMPEPKESADWTGISGPQANKRRQTAAKSVQFLGVSRRQTCLYVWIKSDACLFISAWKGSTGTRGLQLLRLLVAFTKPEQKWKANRKESSLAARSQSCVVHNGFGWIITPVWCFALVGWKVNSLMH